MEDLSTPVPTSMVGRVSQRARDIGSLRRSEAHARREPRVASRVRPNRRSELPTIENAPIRELAQSGGAARTKKRSAVYLLSTRHQSIAEHWANAKPVLLRAVVPSSP